MGAGRLCASWVSGSSPLSGSRKLPLKIAHANGKLLDCERRQQGQPNAHLHVWRAAADIDAAATASDKLPYVGRARVRADTAYAITKIREAIDALLSAHGASSFADASPLQRIWRDSNTTGRHAVVDPLVNQEVYGKALLGIPYEENITPLI